MDKEAEEFLKIFERIRPTFEKTPEPLKKALNQLIDASVELNKRFAKRDAEIERLRARVSIIDAVEKTNRMILDECKRLNAVNERLRRVEAAALDTDKCVSEFPDDLGACQESFEQLRAVLHNNPRPEE